VCDEPTERRDPVGRGRRPYYGRACACDRALYGLGDADITGVMPMARVVWKALGRPPASAKTMRMQFARMRDSDEKNPDGRRYHVYRNGTSCVSSLQAWGRLHAEDMAGVRARRMANLRQFQALTTLTVAPAARIRGVTVGGGTNSTPMGTTRAD